MPISREEFEDERFYRERSTKKQLLFLTLFLKNPQSAFKTSEVAKEIYGKNDTGAVAKAYYVLSRLTKKGFIEKKTPYWALKKKNTDRNLKNGK
jgi:Fe2+ or Zn2+ uptake regulation protein